MIVLAIPFAFIGIFLGFGLVTSTLIALLVIPCLFLVCICY